MTFYIILITIKNNFYKRVISSLNFKKDIRFLINQIIISDIVNKGKVIIFENRTLKLEIISVI